MSKHKMVKLTPETYDRIVTHGKFRETFDQIISRAFDALEGKKR